MNDEQKRLLGDAIEHADKVADALSEIMRLEPGTGPEDWPGSPSVVQIRKLLWRARHMRTACREYADVRLGKPDTKDLGKWLPSAKKRIEASLRDRGCAFVPERMACKCGSDIFERDVVVCMNTHREIGFHPLFVESLREQGHEL